MKNLACKGLTKYSWNILEATPEGLQDLQWRKHHCFQLLVIKDVLFYKKKLFGIIDIHRKIKENVYPFCAINMAAIFSCSEYFVFI